MTDDLNVDAVRNLLLDRYRVEGLLGEGGLGTVVKAFDTRLKRMVAIKTLKRSSYTDDPSLFRAFEERFAREAEAGSRMGSHPNLVTVYDLVTDADRTQYLILEYVPGGTLADRLRQGALPLPDALRLASDVARGTQAAHNVGIIHRDIKPANIFLSGEGRAQLGDFGIAQIDDISGRTQTVTGHPGTPLYMSPEQTGTTGYLQPSSDQYSLGLVLFETLTGSAYRRLSAQDVRERRAALPPPVAALIERMTAADPDARYPSVGAALAAIQAIERYVLTADDDTALPKEDQATRGDIAPPVTLTPQPDAPTPFTGATSGTPPVNLQPAPPAGYASSPPVPVTAPRGGNRGVLIGIGGVLLLAVIAVGALFALRGGASNGPAQTATVSASAAVAQATGGAGQPTASPTAQPAATPASGAVSTPTAASTPAPTTGPTTAPAAASAPATPPGPTGPAPVTSLLSYLDGRVPLPGEPRGDDYKTLIGDPVQVVGVDLSRSEPAALPAVTAPSGSRVVRTIWAPKGTLLATLVRAPVQGGFSDTLDLVVIDIATSKATTVAKAINTLPSWSPDGTTLVYGLITGREKGTPINRDGKPQTFNGTTEVVESTGFDVHLVNADGTKDRVIAHLLPFAQCGGGGGLNDPIIHLVSADQFVTGAQQTAWAVDNSLIAFVAFNATFTFRPDGSQVKQVGGCGDTPDPGTLIGATTDDLYVPTNGVTVRLQDDADALRWRYERGLFPTTILGGCSGDDATKSCDNTKKGTANAGYRNQIIARLADGTEKTLTSSPTFKYHVAISPDGTAVAFTGITVGDYATAAKFDSTKGYQSYSGYNTDVYIIRLSGGAEQKASASGGGHHPSWQRDIPVTIPPRPTPVPTVTPTVLPAPSSTPVPTSRPQTATGSTVAWSDPERRITLSYSTQQWREIKDGTDQYTIFGLQSVDAIFFYVGKYSRDTSKGPGTALDGIQAYRDRQLQIPDRTYSQGPIQQIRIDGAFATTMTFQWTKKSDPSIGRAGTVWYIDGPDRQFVIETYVDGKVFGRRDDVTAVINSIRITK